MLSPKIRIFNNLTVVFDHIPQMYSATVGLWSKIGSRVENPNNNGLCHFLEHMVFKGTKTRNTFEISLELENKGGYMNAYTSKEKTAWYAKALKNDVPLALDIVFDIVKNSTFPEEELEKEKGVIIEEIKMYNDDTSDIAHNLYDKLCYGSNSLAYPIIGSEQNIRSFDRNTFINHIKQYYYPSKMVVVVSGNFDEDEVTKVIEDHTKSWENIEDKINYETPSFHSQTDIIVKPDVEQTNIVYGLPGYSYKDDNYFPLSILSTLMGGGMSSRLFVEIREKRGLAYFANSFVSSYSDCGTWATQVGCNADNVNTILDIIKSEISKASTDLTDEEVNKAKNQIISSLLMSLENTRSRCERIASNILTYGQIKDINEIISKISTVSTVEIKNMLTAFTNAKPTIAVVSNKEISLP